MLNLGLREDKTPEARAITAFRALLQAGDAYRHKVAIRFHLGWTEVQAIGHLLGPELLGQTELAHRLGITTGAATALVDRLERADLAARHPHPQDRRRSMIVLTERGHRLVEATRGWTRHAFDGVEPEDLEALTTQLLAMAANLNHQIEVLDSELDAVDRL